MKKQRVKYQFLFSSKALVEPDAAVQLDSERENDMKNVRQGWIGKTATAVVSVVLLGAGAPAMAQPARVLGADISYWNCGTSSTGISQNNWNTAYTTGNRQFVFLRATRGGTTGVDQTAGVPGGGTLQTLSQRYDDPRFVQNVVRATAAGMVAGPYHFGRPDVAGNTGTDEANHFIQMAGAWMRPGYIMPMFDQEAGQSLGGDVLVQFANDFSARIYAVMQIRPCIYINGTYSSTFQGATQARRDTLAKPVTYTPSVVGPAYPMLWDAYYTSTLDIQTANPKDGYSGFYGPWDDYGVAHPWSFWQHTSAASIAGFNAVDSTVDSDVSHGDIEYVRNYLVPAVWWNDSSGDWGTLANWNSGQTPVAPVTPPDQPTPYATGPLPTPRLPGAAGSGPTSGQYDTVILERPNANITVTLSSGAYNIRKLYMRETLNLTGGSLTINYNPTYRANDSATVLHGGPVSAQFSGPVTLSGSASLSVHTLQVDATRTFTVNGGTLTFNTINLMPHSTAPAKLTLGANLNFNPLGGTSATITNGAGSGSSGQLDLGGASRAFNVASGVNLALGIPVLNGGLTKTGPGTMLLGAANTFSGQTVVAAGTLALGSAGSFANTACIVVSNAATFNVAAKTAGFTLGPGQTLAGSGSVVGTVTASGTVSPGASPGSLTFSNNLILAGTTLLEVSRNGSVITNDSIICAGTLTYGGTLTVTNAGPDPLADGDTFRLFKAASSALAFSATNLPPLAAGLQWDASGLGTGVIKVAYLNMGPPAFQSVAQSGTNLLLLGSNGIPGKTYYLLTSTNLNLPMANWTRLLTNIYGPGGSFSNSIPVDPVKDASFYRLQSAN